ncbi:MAG TPA: flagellar hook capping FlgD N-terminal domain-containing protein [Acidobacteriota bacterium]|nr:flagellar hook capping FlgD N-terminal domain-containing protein [Acidobacteriota bacterium]
MPVTSATSTTTAGYSDLYNSTGGAARKTTKVLGSDDFMKLLATQFQNQDPMKPMEDTAFIAQMAQFSALEQNKTMASQITALRADQQLLMANSYLGRTVTVEDADGKSVTGVVTALEDTEDGVMLTIGEKAYSLYSVRRIEPTATQQSSTATDGTAA